MLLNKTIKLFISFYLKTLIYRFFLLQIFYVIPKKTFRFSLKHLFRIEFRTIAWYLTLNIIFVPFCFGSIEKKPLRYIQYPRKNVIVLFIISSKTPYFFIYNWPSIIECKLNFIINKGTIFSVWFFIDIVI